MSKPENFPLVEIAVACEQHIARGAFILQKWTCEGCGARVTASNVNTLTEKGHHSECGHVTDMRIHGCNYALIQPSRPMTVAELEQALGLSAPGIH